MVFCQTVCFFDALDIFVRIRKEIAHVNPQFFELVECIAVAAAHLRNIAVADIGQKALQPVFIAGRLTVQRLDQLRIGDDAAPDHDPVDGRNAEQKDDCKKGVFIKGEHGRAEPNNAPRNYANG